MGMCFIGFLYTIYLGAYRAWPGISSHLKVLVLPVMLAGILMDVLLKFTLLAVLIGLKSVVAVKMFMKLHTPFKKDH